MFIIKEIYYKPVQQLVQVTLSVAIKAFMQHNIVMIIKNFFAISMYNKLIIK